jgi:hypothetical protein
METDKFGERLLEVYAAMGKKETPESVRDKARALKLEMTKVITDMWGTVNALDASVPLYARGLEWTNGYLFEELAASAVQASNGRGSIRPPAYDRKTRTLEIADGLMKEGKQTVQSDEIAELLRAEGDPAKGLVVAIGNILNRSGWRKVRRGLYEPTERA